MQIRTESDFDQLLRGAKLLAVASAWNELGVWDALAGHDTPTDLHDLPGDTRALSLTAPVLAHAGLLDGAGSTWAMSTQAREMHARGEMPTARNFAALEDLAKMAEVLREGGPVKAADGEPKLTRGGVSEDDPEAARQFLSMLYRRSEAPARNTAVWIARRVSRGGHVLDVGGGHGRYAEALLERGGGAELHDARHRTLVCRGGLRSPRGCQRGHF